MSWSHCLSQTAAGLMLAQMKGGGMDGAVPRLPAKRGFSPLLSPGVPESQLDAVGGISGE